MESFKDAKGREWKFPAFTLGLVLDIKDQTRVDFLGDDSRGSDAKGDAGKWFGMLYDPYYLGGVLWVIFQEEIKKRGVKDERAFARLFDGPALQAARLGIVQSLVSFIHSSEVATAIRAELPAIHARIDAALIAQWRSTLTASLASLESKRAATVSANSPGRRSPKTKRTG